MNAETQLKERHEVAVAALKSVAFPKIKKEGLKKQCKAVASNLGVSYQTVINYVYGMAKDGFLTEAITKEFKKL